MGQNRQCSDQAEDLYLAPNSRHLRLYEYTPWFGAAHESRFIPDVPLF
jgi:hypothetical protein